MRGNIIIINLINFTEYNNCECTFLSNVGEDLHATW